MLGRTMDLRDMWTALDAVPDVPAGGPESETEDLAMYDDSDDDEAVDEGDLLVTEIDRIAALRPLPKSVQEGVAIVPKQVELDVVVGGGGGGRAGSPVGGDLEMREHGDDEQTRGMDEKDEILGTTKKSTTKTSTSNTRSVAYRLHSSALRGKAKSNPKAEFARINRLRGCGEKIERLLERQLENDLATANVLLKVEEKGRAAGEVGVTPQVLRGETSETESAAEDGDAPPAGAVTKETRSRGSAARANTRGRADEDEGQRQSESSAGDAGASRSSVRTSPRSKPVQQGREDENEKKMKTNLNTSTSSGGAGARAGRGGTRSGEPAKQETGIVTCETPRGRNEQGPQMQAEGQRIFKRRAVARRAAPFKARVAVGRRKGTPERGEMNGGRSEQEPSGANQMPTRTDHGDDDDTGDGEPETTCPEIAGSEAGVADAEAADDAKEQKQRVEDTARADTCDTTAKKTSDTEVGVGEQEVPRPDVDTHFFRQWVENECEPAKPKRAAAAKSPSVLSTPSSVSAPAGAAAFKCEKVPLGQKAGPPLRPQRDRHDRAISQVQLPSPRDRGQFCQPNLSQGRGARKAAEAERKQDALSFFSGMRDRLRALQDNLHVGLQHPSPRTSVADEDHTCREGTAHIDPEPEAGASAAVEKPEDGLDFPLVTQQKVPGSGAKMSLPLPPAAFMIQQRDHVHDEQASFSSVSRSAKQLVGAPSSTRTPRGDEKSTPRNRVSTPRDRAAGAEAGFQFLERFAQARANSMPRPSCTKPNTEENAAPDEVPVVTTTTSTLPITPRPPVYPVIKASPRGMAVIGAVKLNRGAANSSSSDVIDWAAELDGIKSTKRTLQKCAARSNTMKPPTPWDPEFYSSLSAVAAAPPSSSKTMEEVATRSRSPSWGRAAPAAAVPKTIQPTSVKPIPSRAGHLGRKESVDSLWDALDDEDEEEEYNEPPPTLADLVRGGPASSIGTDNYVARDDFSIYEPPSGPGDCCVIELDGGVSQPDTTTGVAAGSGFVFVRESESSVSSSSSSSAGAWISKTTTQSFSSGAGATLSRPTLSAPLPPNVEKRVQTGLQILQDRAQTDYRSAVETLLNKYDAIAGGKDAEEIEAGFEGAEHDGKARAFCYSAGDGGSSCRHGGSSSSCSNKMTAAKSKSKHSATSAAESEFSKLRIISEIETEKARIDEELRQSMAMSTRAQNTRMKKDHSRTGKRAPRSVGGRTKSMESRGYGGFDVDAASDDEYEQEGQGAGERGGDAVEDYGNFTSSTNTAPARNILPVDAPTSTRQCEELVSEAVMSRLLDGVCQPAPPSLARTNYVDEHAAWLAYSDGDLGENGRVVGVAASSASGSGASASSTCTHQSPGPGRPTSSGGAGSSSTPNLFSFTAPATSPRDIVSELEQSLPATHVRTARLESMRAAATNADAAAAGERPTREPRTLMGLLQNHQGQGRTPRGAHQAGGGGGSSGKNVLSATLHKLQSLTKPRVLYTTQECSICLEVMQRGDRVTTLSCGNGRHCFHAECIQHWVLQQSDASSSAADRGSCSLPCCPLCKERI